MIYEFEIRKFERVNFVTKPKVVVFDLYDTLLHDIKFDFNSGLIYLYEEILSKDIDKFEFLNYAATYWKELYDSRDKDNIEVAFDDELLDLKNKYGFREDYQVEEILLNCALKMNSVELFEDTIFILEHLNNLGIPVYLLSNAIFKKEIMKKIINRYDLEKYFKNIHFSADYKLRKPHQDLFKVIFEDIKKDNDSIEKNQIYFIGDNFEADVKGAGNFGFIPVFINRKQDTDVNRESYIEIKSLSELLEVMS